MAPGAAVVRDGADDHLPASIRGGSAGHVYSDRGRHAVLARRWWIMLHGWVEGRCSSRHACSAPRALGARLRALRHPRTARLTIVLCCFPVCRGGCRAHSGRFVPWLRAARALRRAGPSRHFKVALAAVQPNHVLSVPRTGCWVSVCYVWH